jgi:uncharacterized repeat protein (TIGR02543 family)
MNMDITSILRSILFVFLSLSIMSCSSDEDENEEPIKSALLSGFYYLKIDFIEAEQDLGVVNIQPNNLVCKTTCTSNLTSNTLVDLIASPKAGAFFISWGGACSGKTTCQVIMSSNQTVTALFASSSSVFPISLQTSKGGSITLADELGECLKNCKLSFIFTQKLILSAIPDTGYIFIGWTRACSGNSTCQVTMSEARTVKANFEKETAYTLATEISIGGSISLQNGIFECLDSCKFNLEKDMLVDIIATPQYGYTFKNWLGGCTGIGQCQVTIDGAKSVTANFEASPTFVLKTSISSGGSISLKEDSITCAAASNCDFNIVQNEAVIIKPKPATGFIFTGWSGDCTGKSTCELTMSAEHNIAANFIKIPAGELLTLQMSAGGSIALANTLGECFINCQLSFSNNETLTATATPDIGYAFTSWSGDCTGNNTCEVTMSTAHSITATFTEIAAETTLSIVVQQEGNISFSNSMEDCIIDCQLNFTQQESVTLTATPKTGYVFYGWSGDCVGDTDCLVNMASNQTVTAIFKASSHSCTAQAPLPANNFDAETEFLYNNPANNGSKVETLLTDFIVKESSGKGASNYPVSMVFPLKESSFFHPGDFHIKNSAGEVIPAQFNVINRWWAKDRSLRHIQAHFNVDIDPYISGQADTGIQTFNLYSGKGNIKPNYSVCATESDTEIRLDNGLVDITITKNPLTITTPAGKLKSLFVKENGENDNSFDHDNIKIELEEIGYLRTIVKISSLTNYVSPTDIKHGWTVRLYMYANSDKVKVDFQLQNSALNAVYSAPMYFMNHRLVLDDTGSTENHLIQADIIDSEKISSGLSGAISTPKVNVFLRDFWQKFPLGLKSSSDNTLSIELWPSWSKQYVDQGFALAEFYWLDDMKQTYKEVLLDFSRKTNAEYINNTAQSFQYSPVAVLPQAYYQKTQVTFELGGFMPTTEIPTELARLPQYKEKDFNDQTRPSISKFGQDNFALGIDRNRKRATNTTGGTPYSQRYFYVSGNPQDYYSAQDLAKAELNIRPQWLSGYTHDNNYSEIKPTANPYGGDTWRKFVGHGGATLTRDYISGSMQVAHPRDDQHAWFYHVEHAYLMSGNKWIKDWFEFMAEYKMTYLQELDPFLDKSHRAEGHNLSVALSAYRVTNNKALGDLLLNYTRDVHNKRLLPPHNISRGQALVNHKAALFQLGYLVKPFIELTYDFPDQTLTLDLIKYCVDWNYSYANFSYYRSITDSEVNTTGNGTALSFVDAAIWFSLQSRDAKYANHAINYVQVGIGGIKPYGKWSSWTGRYWGQLYNYYLQYPL